MSIALSEFWTRLVREGVAEAADCKRMANAYADAHSGSPASDPQSLAEFLVQAGELTEFQARCLTSAAFVELRHGDFVQSTDQVTRPLSHWLPVQELVDRRDGFLIRVGPNQFTDSRFQWLVAHASVSSPALQPFEVRGDVGQGIEIFSPLSAGRSLFEMTSKKMRVEKNQALSVGIAVAEALIAMHARSLVHGAVRADRIWLTAKGKTLLLRDPSGPPAGPHDDQSAAWIDVLESPGAYAAPEFADPSYACTELTDIYSLGCLLFRMVVGRMPVEAPTIADQINAHATEAPPELAAAIGQGESGDPVLRVIAYAMAKSPAARFASAQQLCDALKAVLAMTTDGASSKSKIAQTTPTPVTPPPVETASPSDRKSSAAAAGEAPTSAQPPEPPKRSTTSAAADRPTRSRSPQQSAPTPSQSQLATSQEKSAAPELPAPTAAAKAAASPPPREPVAKPDSAPSATPPSKSAMPKSSATKSSATKSPPSKPAASKPAASKPAASKPQRQSAVRSEQVSSVPEGPPAAQPPSTTNRVAGERSPTAGERGPETGQRAPETGQRARESPPPPPVEKRPAETATPPVVATGVAAIVTAAKSEGTESKGSVDKDEKPVRRRRKRKKSGVPLILGMMCVPVLMLIVGLIVQGRGQEEEKPRFRPPPPAVVPSVGKATRSENDDSSPPTQPVAPSGYQLVDDAQLLWVPPYGADTSTAPLELLPPGPSMIVSLQLAHVLRDPVGQDVIDALSPELTKLIDSVVERARVPAESIARCTAALHPGQDGWPEVSLAIELTEPLPIEELAGKWQASASRTPTGATVYAGDEADGDVYYLGDSDQGAVAGDATVQRFAVGSLEQIGKVAAIEGGAIPLALLLDKVWKKSSAEADLVALITPNFLFADGRQMLLTAAPELVGPLKKMLIPDVAGLLISAKSTDQQLYAELCAVPSGGVTEPRLLRNISDTFQSWPAWSETFLQESVPDASWRLLATRMPFMLRFLVDHTRFGASDGTIMANAYLPGSAASQVTLATVLAMNTKPGGPAIAVSTPTKTLTAQEMLDRKMSIAFDQESLEFGINIIAEQFETDLPDGSEMINVRIIGGDLEKGGITQNQQIRDFSKQDLPFRTVLTDLLLGANPDKTATGPKDPKQALVWVLVENADQPTGYEILVTTRAASEGVYELPSEFKIDE